jgi:hypothetical protein
MPASLCPFQGCGERGGFLNGLSVLLVGVGHGSHKIASITGYLDGPRRA